MGVSDFDINTGECPPCRFNQTDSDDQLDVQLASLTNSKISRVKALHSSDAYVQQYQKRIKAIRRLTRFFVARFLKNANIC